MIVKWAYGFLKACDSVCIVYDIYLLSFSDFDKRSTSLNDLLKTVNFAPPMTVVALDGVMVIVVLVKLT